MKTISIRFDEKMVKYLQEKAHYASIEMGKNISFSEIVREAVEKTYPLPKEKHGHKSNVSKKKGTQNS